MEGCEEAFERVVINRVDDARQQALKALYYVEIGVCHGGTLRAVAAILKERASGITWHAVGIDIVNYLAGDLNKWSAHVKAGEAPVANQVSFYLYPDGGEDFLKRHWNLPIDIALIDGCHSSQCAKGDFLAVAKHCVPGSIVLFHDAAKEDEEEPSKWNHEEGIKVYTALEELGLLDDMHPGWKFLAWIKANKARGARSLAVVQKV